jgi:hypothetical protein
MTAFFTAARSIALDSLPKWQKYDQEYFVQNIFPSLLNEKKRFSRQRTAIIFLCTWTTRWATMGIDCG